VLHRERQGLGFTPRLSQVQRYLQLLRVAHHGATAAEQAQLDCGPLQGGDCQA
jgi:hypothetical protein